MIEHIQDHILQRTEKLMINKLSYLPSQSSLQQLLKDFVSSEEAEVFLILADMNNISMKIINHTRVLIEEAELEEQKSMKHTPKLFVLLLHFPALFYKHCYPTLFLKGWDHMYLDTIAHYRSESMIDIEDWFKNCWCSSTEKGRLNAEDNVEILDPLAVATHKILPLTIPILSARIQFGRKNDESFNSIMKAMQRSEALKKLMCDYGLGKVLCERFSSYWKPKVKLELLERAAIFSKQRQSTLNITESINTNLRTLFFDFCVYMITLANENYNLDILYAEEVSSSVHHLFVNIFKIIKLPEMNKLSLLSKHFIPMEPFHCHLNFPFFVFVCKKFEEQVQTCLAFTNLQTELSNEQGPLKFSNILDPEARLNSLVERVLDSVESLQQVSKQEFCIVRNRLEL